MVDPRGSYDAATRHARKARRSAGRLFVSGIGFSAAYFLDPDHGTARRKRAVEFLQRTRRAIGSSEIKRDQPDTPERDPRVPDPRVETRMAANGSRTAAHW